MAGLLGGISNAAKALAAHEAGAQIAGRNLANVNNPNYARQRVQLGDRAVAETQLGPAGTGAEARGVQQLRDALLDSAVTRELSQSASLAAQQSALERAEANLGEQVDRAADAGAIGDAAAGGGVSGALNQFFAGWEELSARPSDAGVRQLLLQKAGALADKLNVTDARLASLQGDLTTQVAADTETANGLLKEIADLNGEIAQFEVQQPGSAIDLRDQRQAKIEELAKYLDIAAKPIAGSAGQIQVTARDAGGAEIVLVDKTTVHALSFDGTQLASGSPPAALAPGGGSIHGNLAARDGAVQQLRDDLRTVARQLAAAVNGAYNPGGVGSDFFQVPAGGLLAVNPALSATTLRAGASGNAGANDLALAVAGVAGQKFSTAAGDAFDGTIGGFFGRTVSGFGEKLAGVETKLADQGIVEKMVTTQREAVSGVSMDEEMADLMKFQRAFQASARVMRTLDEMLEDVVNGLGR